MTRLEDRYRDFYRARFLDDKTINGMMKLQVEELNETEMTTTISLVVEDWQLNPVNTMHGGMIATLLDVSMGCSAYVFSDAFFTPTISMSVNYVRAIHAQEKVVVKSYIDYMGMKTIQTRCIAYVDGRIVATANGSYTIFRKKD